MESDRAADYLINMAFRDMPVTDPVAESNRRRLLDGLTKLMAGDLGSFRAIYHPATVFHEASCLPCGADVPRASAATG